MTLLILVLANLCLGAVAYSMLSIVLAKRQTSFRKRISSLTDTHLVQPAISVIIPVKGPAASLRQTIDSIFDQSYGGEIELVLAFQDEEDPELDLVASIEERPNRRFRILKGLAFLGLNPKNSNLLHGLRVASHAWIYFGDADTILPCDFFQSAFKINNQSENSYLTTLSIHSGAATLGSHLESAATNFEMTAYLLATHLGRHGGAINGASLLIHRNLLARIGGMEIALNKLTDDLVMTQQLAKIGAVGHLSPFVARVRLEHETFHSFWKRLQRWTLIAKYYDKRLYFAAPLGWAWQWAFILGVLTSSPILLSMSALVILARVMAATVILKELSDGTWGQCAFRSSYLLLMDVFGPLIWFSTVTLDRISWAGQTLLISANGNLRIS